MNMNTRSLSFAQQPAPAGMARPRMVAAPWQRGGVRREDRA